MGEALIRGLIRSGVEPSTITATDVDGARLSVVAEEHRIRTVASNAAAADADVIMVAVKPKDIANTLADIKETAGTSTLVISIAAAVNCRTLAAGLAEGARVVRAMPNAAAEKGAAITAISSGGCATRKDLELAQEIFSSVGLATIIDEQYMNIATAISGNGPAYFYFVVKVLTDAGVENGLDRDTAYALAHETMFGASRMLKYSKKSPEKLIDMVRSPGGLTEAALVVFDERGLADIIKAAINAALSRGGEIEREIEKAGS